MTALTCASRGGYHGASVLHVQLLRRVFLEIFSTQTLPLEIRGGPGRQTRTCLSRKWKESCRAELLGPEGMRTRPTDSTTSIVLSDHDAVGVPVYDLALGQSCEWILPGLHVSRLYAWSWPFGSLSPLLQSDHCLFFAPLLRPEAKGEGPLGFDEADEEEWVRTAGRRDNTERRARLPRDA